jgi:branched-chain amino acid transport system ATP-binding protein
MGLCQPRAGQILFQNQRIDGLQPYQIARIGLALVPEGRRIFPNLTVRENLLMAASDRRAVSEPWTLPRVLDFFPRLAERLGNAGNHLSGGEQQMLAIGRALMTNPLLLILDEATEGLAPLIRKEIWRQLHRLKESGLALILIDKDLQALSSLASRHYILEKGRIVWSGGNETLLADDTLQTKYLGV